MTVRIGIHPNNPTLTALSRTDFLQQRLGPDVPIEWVDVGPGPRAVDYIGAGLVDLSGTGATPPIVAQARGVPLVYVATSDARPVGGIVVRADRPIKDIGDLRGKRVALAIGSWLQQLVSVSLERARLTWNDVITLELPDPVARRALAEGGIDAWAAPSNLESGAFRYLERTQDLIGNRSVFFASRAFAEGQPERLAQVVAALNDVDSWIQAQPADAARLLAEGRKADVSVVADWTQAILARPWGVLPVSDGFLDEQQRTADLFYRFGTLQRRIDVREAVAASAAR